MTSPLDNPKARTRLGRRYLSQADKAALYNITLDAGIRQYGAKCYLYTARYEEAWNFFQQHPELREQPEEDPTPTGETL